MSVFEPVMNSELGEAEGLFAVADGVVLSGQWQSSSKELITRPPALPRLLPICCFPLVRKAVYLEASGCNGSW